MQQANAKNGFYASTLEMIGGNGSARTVFDGPGSDSVASRPETLRKRDRSDGLARARGEEWILVVDDDPMLLDVCSQMLEHLGYRVMPANSGEEALELYRAHSALFDLVISDMNMPGISGAELTRELLAIRPDLPILLCTGYCESMSASQARAIGAGAFRLKPMPIAEMARCVRLLIDRVH